MCSCKNVLTRSLCIFILLKTGVQIRHLHPSGATKWTRNPAPPNAIKSRNHRKNNSLIDSDPSPALIKNPQTTNWYWPSGKKASIHRHPLHPTPAPKTLDHTTTIFNCLVGPINRSGFSHFFSQFYPYSAFEISHQSNYIFFLISHERKMNADDRPMNKTALLVHILRSKESRTCDMRAS